MDNLAENETITIGPSARCARHGITLRYNPWKCVPTIIADQDSGLIGGRIPQTQDAWEERCNTNCRDDIVRSSGNELWKRVPKQEFIIKSRRGWGGGWWTRRQFIEIFKKMDFHNYMNKDITFSRSNDIMMYTLGKHTQLTLVEGCTRNMGFR